MLLWRPWRPMRIDRNFIDISDDADDGSGAFSETVSSLLEPIGSQHTFTTDVQLLLPENAAFVAQWEWQQTVRKTYECFEAQVLPCLRSLIPAGALDRYLPPPCRPGDELMAFDISNLRFIAMGISNNIGAMSEIPAKQIVDYIKVRASTLFKFIELDQGHNMQAFGEKLLSYAIRAKDAHLVEYLLSDGRFSIEVNQQVINVMVHKHTPVELSAQLQDVQTTRILISHGANVNRMFEDAIFGTIYGGALRHAIAIPSLANFHPSLEVLANIEPRLVEVLLQAGAEITSNVISQFIGDLPVNILELIINYGFPHYHGDWSRGGIYHSVMKMLPKPSACRIARKIISLDANAKDIDRRLEAPMNGAAERGCFDLFNLFLDAGSLPTAATLQHAIRGGNGALLRRILDYTVEPNRRCEESDTFYNPIAEAIHTEDRGMIQSLMAKDCLFHSPCEKCFRQIFLAAVETANLEVLRTLVRRAKSDSKAKILGTFEYCINRPYTILADGLMEALRMNQRDVVLFLLAQGIELAANHNNFLEAALETRDQEIVRAILDNGGPVRMTVKALEEAALWGDLNVIEELTYAYPELTMMGDDLFDMTWGSAMARSMSTLKRCDPMVMDCLIATDWSWLIDGLALGIAVHNNDSTRVHQLLEQGAPIHYESLEVSYRNGNSRLFWNLAREQRRRYPQGKTPCDLSLLCLACSEGDMDLLRYLLEGRSYSHRLGVPLGHAIELHPHVRYSLLRLLISHGADPNGLVRNSIGAHGGKTALLAAIDTAELATVQCLVDMGADISWPAAKGIKRTPLQAAAGNGCMDIVEYLLLCGADPNEIPAVRGGATALQLAAIGGHRGIAERLLMEGAEVNGPTAKVDGMSAIEGAAAFGRIDMARLLLENGAMLCLDVGEREPKAVRLAKQEGHVATSRLLESWLSKNAGDHCNERVVCKNCGKKLSNKSALARHNKTAHSGASPYKCREPRCSRTFARKDTFERHSATHTQAGYIKCSGCEKRFRSDYYRREHARENGGCKRTVGNVPMSNIGDVNAEAMIDSIS